MQTLFIVLSILLYIATIALIGKLTKSFGWSLGCLIFLSPLIYYGAAIGYNGFLKYIHRSTCAEYQNQVLIADPFPEIQSFRWVGHTLPSRAIRSQSIDFVEILANEATSFSRSSDFDAEGDPIWVRVRLFPADHPEAGLDCLEIRTEMPIGADFHSRLRQALVDLSTEGRCAAMEVVSEEQLQASYQFTWTKEITPELTGLASQYLRLQSYEIEDVRNLELVLRVFQISLIGEHIWHIDPFGYTAPEGESCVAAPETYSSQTNYRTYLPPIFSARISND